MTIILLNGSRWDQIAEWSLRGHKAEAPVLRLYRDKAIAGYLLSGVPELRPVDPFATGQESVHLVKYVTH